MPVRLGGPGFLRPDGLGIASKKGKQLAFSQLACVQVLALPSRKGTETRCRILIGESGQGQGGGGLPSLRGGAQSKTDRVLQGSSFAASEIWTKMRKLHNLMGSSRPCVLSWKAW